MTPASVMRMPPNSPCRFVNAPDASTTPNVSYPSASAEMAGNVKHTSVEIPVTISCLRPVAFTASTTRLSVQALTVVLSIVGMPRAASASSGINGPHIFSVVVVTTTGSSTHGVLGQPHDIVLQFEYVDVSDTCGPQKLPHAQAGARNYS